jgi:hypothetical protein
VHNVPTLTATLSLVSTALLERKKLPVPTVVFNLTLYSKTCQQRFGSLGYEEIDAKTYAEWGVDFVSEYSQLPTVSLWRTYRLYSEYDNCFNEGLFGNESVSFKR